LRNTAPASRTSPLASICTSGFGMIRLTAGITTASGFCARTAEVTGTFRPCAVVTVSRKPTTFVLKRTEEDFRHRVGEGKASSTAARPESSTSFRPRTWMRLAKTISELVVVPTLGQRTQIGLAIKYVSKLAESGGCLAESVSKMAMLPIRAEPLIS
jgi:hypothetical protein